MNTTRNARFWAYVNFGYCKLTLRPGQTLQHVTGGWEDEGWSWEAVSWEHDGDAVRRSWSHESRDCDGRHGDYGADACPLSDLAAGNEPYFPSDQERDDSVGHLPAWARLDRRNYDQFAELSGY